MTWSRCVNITVVRMDFFSFPDKQPTILGQWKILTGFQNGYISSQVHEFHWLQDRRCLWVWPLGGSPWPQFFSGAVRTVVVSVGPGGKNTENGAQLSSGKEPIKVLLAVFRLAYFYLNPILMKFTKIVLLHINSQMS